RLSVSSVSVFSPCRPPSAPLFPYTTLFRSSLRCDVDSERGGEIVRAGDRHHVEINPGDTERVDRRIRLGRVAGPFKNMLHRPRPGPGDVAGQSGPGGPLRHLPHDDDDRNLDPIRSTAEGGVELVAVRVRHDRRRWGDVVRRPPVNPEPTDSGEPVAQLVHPGREVHTVTPPPSFAGTARG